MQNIRWFSQNFTNKNSIKKNLQIKYRNTCVINSFYLQNRISFNNFLNFSCTTIFSRKSMQSNLLKKIRIQSFYPGFFKKSLLSSKTKFQVNIMTSSSKLNMTKFSLSSELLSPTFFKASFSKVIQKRSLGTNKIYRQKSTNKKTLLALHSLSPSLTNQLFFKEGRKRSLTSYVVKTNSSSKVTQAWPFLKMDIQRRGIFFFYKSLYEYRTKTVSFQYYSAKEKNARLHSLKNAICKTQKYKKFNLIFLGFTFHYFKGITPSTFSPFIFKGVSHMFCHSYFQSAQLNDIKNKEIMIKSLLGVFRIQYNFQSILLKNNFKYFSKKNTCIYAVLPPTSEKPGVNNSNFLNGILLVGFPEKEKNFLMKTLATENKIPLITQSASLLLKDSRNLNDLLGVEDPIQVLFDKVKAAAPCICFINDLDSIGKQRYVQESNLPLSQQNKKVFLPMSEKKNSVNQILPSVFQYELKNNNPRLRSSIRQSSGPFLKKPSASANHLNDFFNRGSLKKSPVEKSPLLKDSTLAPSIHNFPGLFLRGFYERNDHAYAPLKKDLRPYLPRIKIQKPKIIMIPLTFSITDPLNAHINGAFRGSYHLKKNDHAYAFSKKYYSKMPWLSKNSKYSKSETIKVNRNFNYQSQSIKKPITTEKSLNVPISTKSSLLRRKDQEYDGTQKVSNNTEPDLITALLKFLEVLDGFNSFGNTSIFNKYTGLQLIKISEFFSKWQTVINNSLIFVSYSAKFSKSQPKKNFFSIKSTSIVSFNLLIFFQKILQKLMNRPLENVNRYGQSKETISFYSSKVVITKNKYNKKNDYAYVPDAQKLPNQLKFLETNLYPSLFFRRECKQIEKKIVFKNSLKNNQKKSFKNLFASLFSFFPTQKKILKFSKILMNQSLNDYAEFKLVFPPSSERHGARQNTKNQILWILYTGYILRSSLKIVSYTNLSFTLAPFYSSFLFWLQKKSPQRKHDQIHTPFLKKTLQNHLIVIKLEKQRREFWQNKNKFLNLLCENQNDNGAYILTDYFQLLTKSRLRSPKKQGITVIAATNNETLLDAALLRPGRFDTIIKFTGFTSPFISEEHKPNHFYQESGSKESLFNYSSTFDRSDLRGKSMIAPFSINRKVFFSKRHNHDNFSKKEVSKNKMMNSERKRNLFTSSFPFWEHKWNSFYSKAAYSKNKKNLRRALFSKFVDNRKKSLGFRVVSFDYKAFLKTKPKDKKQKRKILRNFKNSLSKKDLRLHPLFINFTLGLQKRLSKKETSASASFKEKDNEKNNLYLQALNENIKENITRKNLSSFFHTKSFQNFNSSKFDLTKLGVLFNKKSNSDNVLELIKKNHVLNSKSLMNLKKYINVSIFVKYKSFSKNIFKEHKHNHFFFKKEILKRNITNSETLIVPTENKYDVQKFETKIKKYDSCNLKSDTTIHYLKTHRLVTLFSNQPGFIKKNFNSDFPHNNNLIKHFIKLPEKINKDRTDLQVWVGKQIYSIFYE